MKRRGGNNDLHQQLLVLKDENSKLREIVTKQGDSEKLREENYRMRHELMIMRNPQNEEAKMMMLEEHANNNRSPNLTELKVQQYNRTADAGFDHTKNEGGQGGFFMTQSEQF